MLIHKMGYDFTVTDTPAYQTFWNDFQWEQFTYECVGSLSDKDKVFIDVGAWIGPISLYAAKLNKTCYAIEPDSIAFGELQTNLQLNDIDNVKLYNMAISNVNGTIRLGSEELGNSNTRATSTKNSFEVESLTMSEFITRNNIDVNSISMIKIDTEGGEVNILKDPFFAEAKIPLHLSIHMPFFENKDDIKYVYDIVRRYSNFASDNNYINNNLSDIMYYDGFYSLLLTN